MNNKFANNNNNTSALGQFLNKAQMGMQMSPGPQRDITDAILDELTLDSDLDLMAENISREFGIDYENALEEIRTVVDGMYNMNVEDVPLEDAYFEEEETPIQPTYDYGFDELSAADDMYYPDDTGFEDEDDLAIEDEQALPLERKGGTISKKKFVKDTLRKLKKASEGMEQSESNEADIRDTPIGGRQSKVNNFRRGIKDLGNEFYAKDIYDNTMQLQQQVSGLSPMAQEGVEVGDINMQETDIENPMHHLQAYSSALSDIFKQPMNQVHGPGYEMPMARKGREQRVANRQARQANRDWQNMFGDMAVGYMGVAGMPNYLQMITPNVMPGQVPQQEGAERVPAGPLVNMSFKKGPWWSGKREWTAEGIPAEMLMGMGMGLPPNYGYGYGPQTTAYDTRRQYPGEIIRSTTTRPIIQGPAAVNNATENLPPHRVTDQGIEILINDTGEYKLEPNYRFSSDGTLEYVEQVSKPITPAASVSSNNPVVNTPVLPETNNPVVNTPDVDLRSFITNTNPEEIIRMPLLKGSLPELEKQLGVPGEQFRIENPPSLTSEDPEIINNDSDNNFPYIQSFDDLKNIDPKTFGFNSSTENVEWGRNAPGKYTPHNVPKKYHGLWRMMQDIDALYDPYEEVYDKAKNSDYVDEDILNQIASESGLDMKNEYSFLGTKKYYDSYTPSEENIQKKINQLSEIYKIPVEQAKKFYEDYVDFQKQLINWANSSEENKKTLENFYQNLYTGKEKDHEYFPFQDSRNRDLELFLMMKGTPGQDPNNIFNYDYKFQSGGAVNNPFSDEYGNLEKFVYGGNEMPEPPILQYEDNYMSSKNVDDPFMFKQGGLYKYQGTGNSQVNPDDYNAWLKRKVEKEALDEYNEWMNRTAGEDPTSRTTYQANPNDQVYQQILQRRMAGLTGNQGQQNQNTKLRGQTPQLRGQYPTAPSVGQQIRGMFSPFQRNPYTGRNYDFMWASQAGPARTADGQIFQPGVGAEQPFPQAQMDPTKPGYRYDYKYEKGPWWSGKRTLNVTGKWVDPTNPNAATTTPAATTPAATTPAAIPSTTTSPPSTYGIYPPVGKPSAEEQLIINTPSYQDPDDYRQMMEEYNRNKQANAGMQFGGYIPNYDDLYRFQGLDNSQVNMTNPNTFDPNINNQTASQCSDSEKMDPNSMCYDPSFRPQDFTATYNLKKARTLNTGNIANIMGAAGIGIQEASRAFDNRYQDQYLRDRTTSDNMAFTNYLDNSGTVSGQNQRRMTEGFTGVVKKGGQIKYKEGGVYDLDQGEIGRILAAGGQIEFI